MDHLQKQIEKLKVIAARANLPIVTATQNEPNIDNFKGWTGWGDFLNAQRGTKETVDYNQWTIREGRTIAISQMPSQHVFNALEMCRINSNKDGAQGIHARAYVRRFNREIIKRAKIA